MTAAPDFAPLQRVISLSGGKDSTATYLLALERGRPFRAVFADTGNEHPWTYEFVQNLPRLTGGPEIQWVTADFRADIERKRRYIAEKWAEKGVSESRVATALELLRPSGNAFLDLCLLKGRFPSPKARFCTQELKTLPIEEQVHLPLLSAGPVVSWQGVRAEESPARALLPVWQRVRRKDAPHSLYTLRPILSWSVEDVWRMHERHGITRNRLYEHGFKRVGCMPCIMARKGEIRRMAALFPEQVDRIDRWERLVSEVSRRGAASFFAHDKTPGAHQGQTGIPMPGIRDVVKWSRTSRGGRQYDLGLVLDEEIGTGCSVWGACE